MAKETISVFDKAVIRTSLFSWEEMPRFESWLLNRKSPFTEEETLGIKEAIYLASPSLYSEFLKWESDTIKDPSEDKKLRDSLYKYFSRMCTRCTPFGLFAGCGTLSFGEETNISLKASDKHSRNTRLDMFFLCELSGKLALKPFIKPYLNYTPSSAIYSKQEELRYVEYVFKSGKRLHQIAEVEQDEFLQLILEKAKDGLVIPELSKLLVDDEITIEDATDFIHELIDAQLLVSELDPAVTGPDLLQVIIQKLELIHSKVSVEHREELKTTVHVLQRVEGLLSKIDQKVGNPISLYDQLENELSFFEIKFDKSKLIQVDLFQEYNAHQLDEKLIDEVKEGIEFLHKLTPYREKETISNFRKNFFEKYETKHVSLAVALDIESGIGYPEQKDGDVSPLIQNVPVGMVGNGHTKSGLTGVLMQRMLEKKSKTVQLDDLKFTGEAVGTLGDTLSVMLRPVSIEGKTYLSFSHAGGTSAANLLGRFAGGNEDILKLVKDITSFEEAANPDKILAEIAHLPQARVGNILTRPKIRKHEIPYLANSYNDIEDKIELDDIYISASPYELKLYSKSRNKLISPKLTTAHNYSFNALPIYQFLCDYQHTGIKSGVAFSWGELKSNASHLPRVTYKNILLSVAEWKVSKDSFKEAYDAKEKSEGFVAFRKALTEKGIPSRVLFVEGDNELFFDFSRDLSIEVFMAEIKKKGTVILAEALFSEDPKMATGRDGKLHNQQIMLCFKNENQEKRKTSVPEEFKENKEVQRSFPIGSEWVYFKVYAGVATADEILVNHVRPLVELFKSNGWIEEWFFIRYSDPEKHFRIRFKCSSIAHLGNIIVQFNHVMKIPLESGKIWKIMADQYEREIERYGIFSIEDSEKLFYWNSEAILTTIQLIKENNFGEDLRWLIGCKMMDALYNAFGFDSEQKMKNVEPIKEGFAREFNANKGTKKYLASKFRNERKSITGIVSGEMDASYQPLLDVVATYQQSMKSIVPQLKEALEQSDKDINEYLNSHIHMIMNRLFRSKQRLHEMVIYDLMFHYYKSSIAREKAMQKKKQALVNA